MTDDGRDVVSRSYRAFKVGPMPAERVNQVLGTELDTADVWVSKRAIGTSLKTIPTITRS